ncbi:BnaC09g32650D [Brassica napus]|uniref:BnaC09g32650D protein n=1 Tax=Brassica napus TaxID=3708 RepID=A0A078GMQ4_BRANA|nr:BnaC09g32650D [Brassica napus]
MVFTDAVGPLLGEITCGTLLQKLRKSWMKLVRAMSKSVLFTRERLNRLPSLEPSFFRPCLMLMLNFPEREAAQGS